MRELPIGLRLEVALESDADAVNRPIEPAIGPVLTAVEPSVVPSYPARRSL